jgi:cystathionine gamma-lyase
MTDLLNPCHQYDYSRSINPNREALEHLLASLENGSEAIAYSSGSAATAAICQWLTLPVSEGGGRKGSKRDEVRVLSISDVVSPVNPSQDDKFAY